MHQRGRESQRCAERSRDSCVRVWAREAVAKAAEGAIEAKRGVSKHREENTDLTELHLSEYREGEL